MKSDPNEFNNLAGLREYRDVVKRLKQWLPDKDVPPAPGSRARILRYDPETDKAVWQGNPNAPDAPIPGI